MSRARAAAPFALATLFYAAFIFWMSSAPRQVPELLQFSGADKLLHILEFGVLAVLSGLTTSRAAPQQHNSWHLAVAAAVTLAFGVSDELHQAYVPGRGSSFYDVCADAVGALLGSLAARGTRLL